MNHLKEMCPTQISGVLVFLHRTLPEKDFVDMVVSLLGITISNAVLLRYSFLGEHTYITDNLDSNEYCDKLISLFEVDREIAEAIKIALQTITEY